MSRLLAILALTFLASCAAPSGEGRAIMGGYGSTANHLQLADGTAVWLITCPGTANNVSTCLTRASAVCPSGYRLLDRQSMDRGAVIAASQSALYGERRVEPEIIVSCTGAQSQ